MLIAFLSGLSNMLLQITITTVTTNAPISSSPQMTTTPFYYTHEGVYNVNFDGDVLLNVFIWIIFISMWVIPLYFMFIAYSIKIIAMKEKDVK